MKYNVRNANITDLKSLVEFIVAEASEAEGVHKASDKILNGIKAGLEKPSIARYWILENQNQDPVGNVSVVKEWSDWNCAYYWWIQSMYLLPNHRGKGLMNQLLQEVKQAARTENAIELRLYVHRNNMRAIKAYQKAGFCNSDYNMMRLRL